MPALDISDFDQAQIETGRKVFAGSVEFVKGAVSVGTLPGADRPEIAFAGRSNVGKSSLINALTGRKALARTSNTPGRTREMNYFRMGDDQNLPFYLVDLPGYGYARVERRQSKAWTQVMKEYLVGRATLRRVMLLIDARHGLKDNDYEIMKMLDTSAVNYQIVLTKMDKLKARERDVVLDKVNKQTQGLIALHPLVVPTSSEKGWGLAPLRAEIANLIAT